MKQVERAHGGTARRLLFTLLLFLSIGAAANGQYYQEVEDFGWARGINFATPTLVDLDGNGLLDLVVGSDDPGLGRWEQSAAGATTFRRIERDFLTPKSNDRSAPIFVDLDGDDRRDMLLANASRVNWYEEDAPGSARYELIDDHLGGIDAGSACRIWFGDLDGDGLQDLLIGSAQSYTQRHIQSSRHGLTFTKARNIAYAFWPQYYHAPLLLDLDGDGLLEMLAGGQDWNIHLYRQDAAVRDSFILVTDTWSGITDAENAVCTVADLDGDGLLDLLVGTKGGHVRHYRQPSPAALDGWTMQHENVLGTWDLGMKNSAAIVDLDGDGRLDILRSEVPFESDENPLPVRHFRQRQPGSYTQENLGVLAGITVGIYEKFTVHDIDADGRLDLFIARLRGGIEHYRQREGEPFLFDLVTNRFLPDVTFPAFLCFADIDANGRLDMLLGAEKGGIARYEADAANSTTFLSVSSEWMRPSGYQHALCFHDLDGDGLLDMLLGDGGGKLRHYEQADPHTAQFDLQQSEISTISVPQRAEPMVFDLNLDGRPDIIVTDGHGGISLFIDEGPNTVRPPARAIALQLRAPWPQPASDLLQVTIDAAASTPVRLSLSDILGRETGLVRDVDASAATSHTLALPVRGLVPGVYMLRVTQGGNMVSRPVIVGR
ncbi:MAG: T9SS type A sorting domain-containing protein [Bacteroidetes bacterium]|nr:T9SS type A sorting domain-containing protein [Bacteroidota bacterium]